MMSEYKTALITARCHTLLKTLRKSQHSGLLTGLHHAGQLMFSLADQIRYRRVFTKSSYSATLPPDVSATIFAPAPHINFPLATNLLFLLGEDIHQTLNRCAAPRVCSVAITRCPVSAAVNARRMVSLSRSSPAESHPDPGAAPRSAAQTRGSGADFPLLDQATLAVMDKLHRIFQRQDMPVEMLIEISTIAARVGFTAAGRARNQNKTALFIQQPDKAAGTPASASCGQVSGNRRSASDRPCDVKRAGAKARSRRGRQRKIYLSARLPLRVAAAALSHREHRANIRAVNGAAPACPADASVVAALHRCRSETLCFTLRARFLPFHNSSSEYERYCA
jgi:hypothetical protein